MWYINRLTGWSRVLLEKLIFTHLFKFLAFYGTWSFITVFTTVHQWSIPSCSPPCFPEIHSNIILLSTPRSTEWSLPFMYSNQNIVRISHFIFLDKITLIICEELYELWSSSSWSRLQSSDTSPLLSLSINLSTLLCSSLLSVRNQVPNPYKQQFNVLY